MSQPGKGGIALMGRETPVTDYVQTDVGEKGCAVDSSFAELTSDLHVPWICETDFLKKVTSDLQFHESVKLTF